MADRKTMDSEPGNVWIERAKKMEAEESYYEAIQFYKTALKIDRRSIFCINSIANCYLRLELYLEAICWYKKSIKRDITSKFAYNGLGNAYDLIGESKEAIKNYEHAIKIDPKFSYPYNGLGNYHFKKGEFESAAKWYEDAARLDPSNCQIKLNLARCFTNLKKYCLAFYQLQKVSNLLREKPQDCRQKFCWIVEEFRETIKGEISVEHDKMKQQFSQMPLISKSPDLIDLDSCIKSLLIETQP